MRRQGIRATTYAEVVRKSGLTAARVKKLAANHEAVVLKLLDDVEVRVIEPIVNAVSKAPTTAEAKMSAFIEGLTRATPGQINRLVFLVLAANEYAAGSGPVAKRASRAFGHLHRTVEGIVQFGWLRGTFRTDIPAKELTTTIVGGLSGTLLEARRQGSDIDRKQIDRAVRLIFLRGLEDRTALERVLSGFVVPGYHP